MLPRYSYIILFLVLVFALLLGQGRPGQGISKADILYHPIAYTHAVREIPHIAIFIHAAVGVFHKKRGKGTWGYGEYILKDVLRSVKESGLLAKASGLYIGLLGAENDRISSKLYIESNYSDGSNTKIQVVAEAENLYFAEFPTLYVLQNYSNVVHKDTLILYLHTKGMRNNHRLGFSFSEEFSWDKYSAMPSHLWRAYMTFFLVDHHDVCIETIRKHGYHTCGVLKQGEVYAGNFWWSSASWLRTRASLYSLDWAMHTRMEAENMLLGGVSWKDNQKHYCLHHTHHNMYDCPTYRSSYEGASKFLRPIRSNSRCHYDHLYKNFGIKMIFPDYCYFANESFPQIPFS